MMMGNTSIEKGENVLLGEFHSGSIFPLGKGDENARKVEDKGHFR